MRTGQATIGARQVRCTRMLGAALVLACGLATLPGDATACGNDVFPAESPELATLKVAKNALATGRYELARKLIRGSFRDIEKAVPGANHTQTGALRVMAVAVARSGGRVSPRTADAKMTVEENLEWAVAALRRINEHRKNEPWRQSDLAEAMAKLPKHQVEARKVLEDLDARDVVATAEGYATLAMLRGEGGDATGREAAVARCKKMTQKPAICQSGRS